jgi:hypothetical protein
MSDINWQLFDEVIADAKAGRREFWMRWWFGVKYYHDIVRNHEAEEEFCEFGSIPDCGAPACACGSAILLRPEQAQLLWVDFGGETFLSMTHLGAKLYGIPVEEAIVLFDKKAWPYHYRRMSDLDGFEAIVERAKREGDFAFLLEGED